MESGYKKGGNIAPGCHRRSSLPSEKAFATSRSDIKPFFSRWEMARARSRNYIAFLFVADARIPRSVFSKHSEALAYFLVREARPG